MNRWKGRWYKPNKTWRQRKEAEYAVWDSLMEGLTDEYMKYQHRIDNTNREAVSPPAQADVPRSPSPNVAAPGDRPNEDRGVPIAYEWSVEVFDIFTLQEEITIERRPTSTSPALDLMAEGWVAKTPQSPNAAVSIATLQLLHRLRQRKASFSFESFAKVVCDYYQVSV